MTLFIIIVIVVLIIAYSGGNKSKNKTFNKYTPPTRKNSRNITVEIKRSSSNTNGSDSIIDVTGTPYRIDPFAAKPMLKIYVKGVPYWQHHYVYSFSEINTATYEQQSFYKLLKDFFHKGEYVELEGNTNYAFILFFDLLDEFIKHKDLNKIESQLEILGQCYPKTSSYAITELIKRLEIIGDTSAIQRLRGKQQSHYQSYYNDYDSWKLGSKYKTQLKLSESEVKVLNKVWQPSNNFGSIEYCCVEIVTLFLKTLDELNRQYLEENSTLEDQFGAIADIVARKHFNYRANSTNYKYSIDQTKDQLYSTIFKYCENTVRDCYEHKRKLSIDFYTATGIIQQEFNSRIGSRIAAIHSRLIDKISPPDESTNIELNSQNTSRWKNTFDKISSNFNGDSNSFIEEIRLLAIQNIKNPSLENIYFESSKFIAKTDKQAALLFYVNYLYCDLQSVKFDNKQLTKTVQKSLFTSNEQLHEFEKIVSDLINTKDLNKAIEAATQFYIPKRKKINLSKDAIAEAHQKHSGTVELLNEYLQDDSESIRNVNLGVNDNKENSINKPWYPNNGKIKNQNEAWYPKSGNNKVRIPPKISETRITWKEEFEKLINSYNSNNSKHFLDSVVSLGNLNKMSPSIESIFLEASKFVCNDNKETALTLYIHYIYSCLISQHLDSKQHVNIMLPKNILVSNDQLLEFQILESQLRKDKDLGKALEKIPKFYTPKRKKIELSKDAIAAANQKHTDTIELLNEYLQDEYEDSLSGVKTEEINSEEVEIQIQKRKSDIQRMASKFTDTQRELLETFQENGLTISDDEIELFAKSRGLFKNQLIESVNDTCYQTLDDLLIEEDGENYYINPDYFQRILTL